MWQGLFSWRRPTLWEQGVTVLFVRPRGTGGSLAEDLKAISARLGERVRLLEVSRLPGAPRRQRHRVPCVRVMRGRDVISEAIGADLPRRELERVIRSAL